MNATIKTITDAIVTLTIKLDHGEVYTTEDLCVKTGAPKGELDWRCIDGDDGYSLAEWALNADRKVGDDRHFSYSSLDTDLVGAFEVDTDAAVDGYVTFETLAEAQAAYPGEPVYRRIGDATDPDSYRERV